MGTHFTHPVRLQNLQSWLGLDNDAIFQTDVLGLWWSDFFVTLVHLAASLLRDVLILLKLRVHVIKCLK